MNADLNHDTNEEPTKQKQEPSTLNPQPATLNGEERSDTSRSTADGLPVARNLWDRANGFAVYRAE